MSLENATGGGDALPGDLRVPIWRTTVDAYRETFGNFGAFATVAALPLVLSALIEAGIAELVTVSGSGGARDGLSLLHVALSTLVVAVFQLCWYRFLLLGGDARPQVLPRPGRRLLPFIGYSLLILLIYLPALVLQHLVETQGGNPSGLMIILLIACFLIAAYFGCRLTFAFLWIASDQPGRLRASWQATRNNGLRILVTLVLTSLPLALLVGVIMFVVGFTAAMVAPDFAAELASEVLVGWTFWIALIVGNLLLFSYYGLSCAVFTKAFEALTGWSRNRSEILQRFE